MSQPPGPTGPWAPPQPPEQPGPYAPPAPPQGYGFPPGPGAAAPPPPYGVPQGYPPVWGPPAPARRSRAPWIIGGAVGLALVLAGGGSFAYWAYEKVSGAGSYRLLPPAEFQGLSRSGNEQHEQVLKDALAKQWEQNRDTRGKFTPMAAVYGTAPRQFTVWGGSGRIAGSAEGPDQGLDAAARGGVLLGTRRTMDPGPLGGTLKCAPVEVQTRTVGICAWSDSSTVVMVLDASGPDGADLEATAERIRAYRSLAEIAE